MKSRTPTATLSFSSWAMERASLRNLSLPCSNSESSAPEWLSMRRVEVFREALSFGKYSFIATLLSRFKSLPMYVTPKPPSPSTRPIR